MMVSVGPTARVVVAGAGVAAVAGAGVAAVAGAGVAAVAGAGVAAVAAVAGRRCLIGRATGDDAQRKNEEP